MMRSVFLLLMFFITSCGFQENKENNNLTKQKDLGVEYKALESLSTNVKLKVPNSWKVGSKDGAAIYCELTGTIGKSIFVILEHRIIDLQQQLPGTAPEITALEVLEVLYDSFESDSTTVEYLQTFEHAFENFTYYQLSSVFEEESIGYHSSSIFFELGDCIYEVSIKKAAVDNYDPKDLIFTTVLRSINISDNRPFENLSVRP